jgi:hypothetical protein
MANRCKKDANLSNKRAKSAEEQSGKYETISLGALRELYRLRGGQWCVQDAVVHQTYTTTVQGQ